MNSCDLCGLPIRGEPVRDSSTGNVFCCQGCREVAGTVEPDADPVESDRVEDTDVEGETAFLNVRGMHCTACERYLEQRARSMEGVHEARVSYASGLMNVEFRPDRTDPETLARSISGMGYRVHPVAQSDESDDHETVGRLGVGGFFGMMVMVWYVLFLYPLHLGVDGSRLLLDLQGSEGTYLLWNLAILSSVVIFYTGLPLLRGAYVSLRAGTPNMDLLVTLAAGGAYLYSMAILITGGHVVYFDITVMIVCVVTLGRYVEHRIRRRAGGLLGELTRERVDRARRLSKQDTESVPLDELSPGDRLLIKPGERVPVDGEVIEGQAAVNESLVTGESRPVSKSPGDTVLGGTLVTDAPLTIRVGEGNSTLEQILASLWNIQSHRAGIERMADRVAAVFVPGVILLSIGTFLGYVIRGGALSDAILSSLSVLIVSCPCALGLATPLAVTAGLRTALERGIVLIRSDIFEVADTIDRVVLDKTGTLTTGRMTVVEGPDSHQARDWAGALEQYSSHPVAEAIVRHASSREVNVSNVSPIPGRGIRGSVNGTPLIVGHPDLFMERGRSVSDDRLEQVERAREHGRIPVLVGWDGEVKGLFEVEDKPRPGWERFLDRMGQNGREIILLTGDEERATRPFKAHPALKAVHADVKPRDKVSLLRRLRSEGTVAMVGDGTNDAPALAEADLGIAMGSGTTMAARAAGVVLTRNELNDLPSIFQLTNATRRRIRQNLGWAFLYNAIAIPAAVGGWLNPLVAALAMATSSLIVVLNSTRSLIPSDPSFRT